MKNTFVRLFTTFILLTCSLVVLSQTEDYKNPNLSFDKRVDDLIGRLTLEEKVSLMQDGSKAIPRLGIKGYNWWNEALHGVARAGLATVFPQPIGMAATFDNEALLRTFAAVSDEGRAKHAHFSSKNSYLRYQGLTMWTPTINIFRDPRWGRGIETYGEDPYLTSVMGVAAVKGLQGPKNKKYDKLHACAKHFAVHSGPEWNRHSFDAKNIKLRDLYETYLPAFEALVVEGEVKEVMCAYNRFEGKPCCGSDQLLIDILRNKWNYQGIVVADCGAVADFYKPNAHATHPDPSSASANAVLSGTDLDCGQSYRSLVESVKKGYIKEQDIDVSVKRLLKARFELGEMDDLKDVSWSKIPYSVVASKEHDKLSLEMARKSMTLLQNKNNFLPLKRGGLTVAVVGPNAHDSIMQLGNYNGTPLRTITILDGIRLALGKDDKLIYEPGCALVATTLFKSAFDRCQTKNGKGFDVKYWNNLDRQGEPSVQTRVETPFRFCTSGATVFAPGVNLEDFSATYTTTFTPDKNGEVVFDFYNCGTTAIYIDGEEFKNYTTKHGSRRLTYGKKMQAGRAYEIQIDFAYFSGDAQLNFDIGYKEEIDINKTVERLKPADVVIFVGGISPQLEGEEMGVDLPGFKRGDRTEIELPDVQRQMIQSLHQAGKKIVMVNCSGSPIALEPETKVCEAILQAWYPGQAGGKAVADVLFGDYNPSGRLPVTFYRNLEQLPDFENYDMNGRTYRYMKQEPLFPFGYGLSYTSFVYGEPKLNKKQIKVGDKLRLTVSVSNVGEYDGEEVVQVYLRKVGDIDGPIKTLRAFKRISLEKGKTNKVVMDIEPKQMEWFSVQQSEMAILPGEYELLVGKSSKAEDLQAVKFTIQ